MPSMGEKVLNMRKEAGWTRRELSRRTGLRDEHLSKIEHGLRTQIEVETIRRLCLALDCTADYLIGLEDDPATWDQAEDPEPAPPPPRGPRGRPRKRPLAATAAAVQP